MMIAPEAILLLATSKLFWFLIVGFIFDGWMYSRFLRQYKPPLQHFEVPMHKKL